MAKECFSATIKSKPDLALAYYLLGVIQDTEKNYTDAIMNYKKFLSLDPKNENTTQVRKRLSIIENPRKK